MLFSDVIIGPPSHILLSSCISSDLVFPGLRYSLKYG